MSTIHIVTQITEYQLDNQWAFIDENTATTKYYTLLTSLFGERATELCMTAEEYMDSTTWWDGNTRTKVYLEEVIVN